MILISKLFNIYLFFLVIFIILFFSYSFIFDLDVTSVYAEKKSYYDILFSSDSNLMNANRHSYPLYRAYEWKYPWFYPNYMKGAVTMQSSFFRIGFGLDRVEGYIYSNFFLPFTKNPEERSRYFLAIDSFESYLNYWHADFYQKYIVYKEADYFLPKTNWLGIYKFYVQSSPTGSRAYDSISLFHKHSGFTKYAKDSPLYDIPETVDITSVDLYIRGIRPLGYSTFSLVKAPPLIMDYLYLSVWFMVEHFDLAIPVHGLIFFLTFISLYLWGGSFILLFLIFFCFYFLLFHYVIIPFVVRRLITYPSHIFYLYHTEEDDVFLSFLDILTIRGDLDRFKKFYNILKLEYFYMEYLLTRSRKIFMWFFTSYDNDYFLDLKFSLINLLYTRIEMPFWAYEDLSPGMDEWSFFPYDFLPIAFPESEWFLKNFENQNLYLFDEAYDGFRLEEEDLFGCNKWSHVEYPFYWKDDHLGSGIFDVFDLNFNLKYFLDYNLNEDFFKRYVERYKKIAVNLNHLNTLVDKAVGYSGSYDTLEELEYRSLDGGLGFWFSHWIKYEEDLNFHVFYLDAEQEEIDDYIDTKDGYYKLSPSVWRFFSLENLYANIFEIMIAQYLINDGVFWDESAPDMLESDPLEDDFHLLLNHPHYNHLVQSFYKNMPLLYSFGEFRGLLNGMNIGSYYPYFKNTEDCSFLKYPPYESHIGFLIWEHHERLKELVFNIKKVEGDTQLIANINYTNLLQKQNCFRKAFFTTYFVGFDGYPMGVSFNTTLYEETLYANGYSHRKDVVEVYEEEDKDYFIDFDTFHEYVEFPLVAIILPVGLTIVFILPKILEYFL